MASKNIWGPSDKESEMRHLIQKLTTTGKKTLDDGDMKKLKSFCKLSDKYVNCAYYSLMTQLRKDHAEIRYSTLLIMNELFLRSSVFRSKLECDFEEFLELVEGTDPENPLPLPVQAAKSLKIKGLEFIKNWATKFGEKHIRLQLAVTYLKKCRKVDFNDMEARNVAERERQQQEQDRLERVINEKISKIKTEIQDTSEEIYNVTTQMENCFKLLIPHSSNDLFSADDFENKNCLSENNQTKGSNADDLTSESETPPLTAGELLRDHGMYDMKKAITIEVKKDSEVAVNINDDTTPLIENLKDLEKQISSRYYPAVTRWLKILSKGSNCSDILKRAIDLKLLLESCIKKYKDLKIKPSKTITDSDDEDDEFEEVQDKEGYEDKVCVPKIPKVLPVSPSHSGSVSLSPQWKIRHKDDVEDPTSAASTIRKRFKNYKALPVSVNMNKSERTSVIDIDKKKAELLEKAPVLPYDIDLYHWEEEKPEVPERIKYDALHRFWESKDDEEESETYKEEQLASLRIRKIDFSGKFEPVKWTCRAPLANGKLCPRKDRIKCPFHGKIIPRDVMGNPSGDPGSIPGPSTEPSTSTVPDWQDPALLRDIEAATGMDLKIPDKKSRKGKKTKDGLTNIKQINNTVRDRLSKKIIKRYRHYAKKIDEMERKRFNDKFGDQWNYY